MAKLMGKRADAVDGLTVVIAAMKLVEHGKHIYNGVIIVGTESTVTAHSIVGCRAEVPITGPDSLRMVP